VLASTLTRRTWLEWVGKATVVGLGAEVLAACTRRMGAGPEDALDAGSSDDAPAEVATDVPNDGMDFEPGSHEIFTGWPERTVDRQDIEDVLATWTLRIDGMVESARTLTFADLVRLPRQDEVMDFHCVEGWSVLDVPWNGVHIRTLLDPAGPLPGATHATFHTLGDRYDESLPLEVALEPHTILAYGVGGSTLPLEHGFPLRLVVPRLFAYKSAKYVTRLELTDHAVEGFWVGYGYPYMGEVPESRLRPGRY
jgi:DMSO/TMAO reductase YedYZ molybdopterin-dependent catalytic subunit